MRFFVVLVALAVMPPAEARADRVLFWEYLNSDLTFGFISPDHAGNDLSDIGDERGTWGIVDGTFQALGASFVEQTLITGPTGNVTASLYLYDGGLFEADFLLRDRRDRGNQRAGFFLAPIQSLTIHVSERFEGGVTMQYVLGPGLLDPFSARHLGARQRIAGGVIDSELFLTDNGNRPGIAGDYTTPRREAWDGVTWVTIEVPEPGATTLLSLGFLSLLLGGRLWRTRRAFSRPNFH